jgi:hypothetical protein
MPFPITLNVTRRRLENNTDITTVLAAFSLSLHTHAKSPFGEKVQSAVLFSPTVFSIMYAAIIGKLLRRVGVYKAERGVKIRVRNGRAF